MTIERPKSIRFGHALRGDGLDVARVSPKLWIGAAPPTGGAVAAAGFDLVVLCAREYQPRGSELPGVEILHAGFDDSGMRPTAEEQHVAERAAYLVADRVAEGDRVAVTCWQGINRSGLVCALTLHVLYGIPGAQATQLVRKARPGALSNPYFVSILALL